MGSVVVFPFLCCDVRFSSLFFSPITAFDDKHFFKLSNCSIFLCSDDFISVSFFVLLCFVLDKLSDIWYLGGQV